MSRRPHGYLVALTAAGLVLSAPFGAIASVAEIELLVEGNTNCSSFAFNQAIFDADANTVDAGAMFTATDGFLTVEGFISSDGTSVDEWVSVGATPVGVDIAILGGRGNAGSRAFLYETSRFSDEVLGGPGGSLRSVTFCYGLESAALAEPECPIPNFQTNVCINVPMGQRLLVPVLDVDVKDFDPDPTDDFQGAGICQCNLTLAACNPELAAGEPGACVEGDEDLLEIPANPSVWQNGGSCWPGGGGRNCFNY